MPKIYIYKENPNLGDRHIGPAELHARVAEAHERTRPLREAYRKSFLEGLKKLNGGK